MQNQNFSNLQDQENATVFVFSWLRSLTRLRYESNQSHFLLIEIEAMHKILKNKYAFPMEQFHR